MALSKRQRRRLKKQGVLANEDAVPQKGMSLRHVQPKTANQKLTFDAYDGGDNLLLHGIAGTGKTFISLYLALDEIFRNAAQQYNKIVVVRSVVPTRDIGFLPGTQDDKIAVYEKPYELICNELFGRGDAYDILKQKELIEFMCTSFIRGVTLTDTIIIVDEIQNMSWSELDTVITRVGENCKIVLCGDFRQSDLQKSAERKGLMTFMEVIDKMNSFTHVEFTKDDIVRCQLVKDFIIAREELGICA